MWTKNIYICCIISIHHYISLTLLRNREMWKRVHLWGSVLDIFPVTPCPSLRAIGVWCGSALLTQDDTHCSVACELFIVIGSLRMCFREDELKPRPFNSSTMFSCLGYLVEDSILIFCRNKQFWFINVHVLWWKCMKMRFQEAVLQNLSIAHPNRSSVERFVCQYWLITSTHDIVSQYWGI